MCLFFHNDKKIPFTVGGMQICEKCGRVSCRPMSDYQSLVVAKTIDEQSNIRLIDMARIISAHIRNTDYAPYLLAKEQGTYHLISVSQECYTVEQALKQRERLESKSFWNKKKLQKYHNLREQLIGGNIGRKS